MSSQKRYHLSQDGEPRICKAKPGDCPIGGEHFATEQEARQDFEARQNSFNPSAPQLKNFVEPKAFGSMITKGYISERTHHDDPTLRVYSYTPKTQFSGMWTEETLLARGLILKVPEGSPEFRKLPEGVNGEEAAEKTFSHAIIHGRGLAKFFTVEQMKEGDWTNVKLVDDDENVTIEEHAPIDFTAKAFVAEKLNGALGVMYLAPDGTAQISTKGSFGSPEAGIATRVVQEKYDPSALGAWLSKEGKNQTPLFEIITPERLHPVDYGDMEDVILLGTVDNATGRWTPATPTHPLTEHGFAVAEQKEVASLGEALALPYQPNTEGLVVTSTNSEGVQRMFKVKPPEYHALRKAFYALERTKATDLYELLTPAAKENLFSLTENEVTVGVEGSLKRFESKVQARTYEKLVKPAQARKKAVQSELDSWLKSTGLSESDPATVGKLGRTDDRDFKYPRGTVMQALKDRQDGTNRLDGAILKQVLSGKR